MNSFFLTCSPRHPSASSCYTLALVNFRGQLYSSPPEMAHLGLSSYWELCPLSQWLPFTWLLCSLFFLSVRLNLLVGVHKNYFSFQNMFRCWSHWSFSKCLHWKEQLQCCPKADDQREPQREWLTQDHTTSQWPRVIIQGPSLLSLLLHL